MDRTQDQADDDGSQLGEGEAGPTAARLLLGAQLRQLREAAGISREDAGYVIRASGSKISRLELGRVSFKPRDVDDLLDLYGVRDGPARATLQALGGQSSTPPWWHAFRDAVPDWLEDYLGLEPSASLIRTYDVQFIPALLRTGDYGRAVLRLSPGDDETALEQRAGLAELRQQILYRPDPPRVWAVIDEAALRRPVGGPTVMRAQIKHLIQAVRLDHVTIQVMPLSAGHAAAGGPISLLRFSQGGLADVVYLEQLATGVYLNRPAETTDYWSALNHLATQARPPAATPSILRKILAEDLSAGRGSSARSNGSINSPDS
jgi:transcriptional regulator with XRE-family HTH domain